MRQHLGRRYQFEGQIASAESAYKARVIRAEVGDLGRVGSGDYYRVGANAGLQPRLDSGNGRVLNDLERVYLEQQFQSIER